MSSAQNDFVLTLDRAAGLTVDAACSARAARYQPLPEPQAGLLRDAIVALERAQDKLFAARHTPWPGPSAPQLTLQ